MFLLRLVWTVVRALFAVASAAGRPGAALAEGQGRRLRIPQHLLTDCTPAGGVRGRTVRFNRLIQPLGGQAPTPCWCSDPPCTDRSYSRRTLPPR